MRSILFPNHYYGRPIIGWKHEIENLGFDDVIKFYKKYYIPNNATLVLSGDVDFENVKKLVKIFWQKKKGTPNIRKCYRSEVRNISYGGNETSNCKAKYLEKIL